MKILLIGQYPPPHGGISVHLLGLQQQLSAAGIPCAVLDLHRWGGKVGFARTLVRYAADCWTIRLHTNGHNAKSWLVTLLCGFVARIHGTVRILTLHSGMVPRYLNTGIWQRMQG